MKYDCRGSNWHIKIADAIDSSSDGDILIVETDSAQELAGIAQDRMRPGLKLIFKVEK